MTKREIPKREPKPKKVEAVAVITQKLQESNGALLTDYRGMSVKAMEDLRTALRERGATYHVLKNTMLQLASSKAGYEAMQEWLEGPTAAVLLGKDIVGPAKTLVDFARGNANLPVIKGGLVEGRRLDAASVKALALLPPREILLATLVGCLQAPMGGLLSTLQAAMGNLVGTLQSLEKAKA